MPFTKMNADVSNIQALPTRPTLEDGYTPDVLKSTFDKAGEDLKSFINNSLIAELESKEPGLSGSEKIGSASISGLDGETVYEQISNLKETCNQLNSLIIDTASEFVGGQIPDGTIPMSKLSAETINAIESSNDISYKLVAFNTAGSYTFTAPKTGIYRIRMSGAGSGGTLACSHWVDESYPIGAGGASGSYAEFFINLSAGDEIPVTVGKGGAAAVSEYIVGSITNLDDFTQSYINFELDNSPGGNTVFGSAQGPFCVTASGGNIKKPYTYSTCTGTLYNGIFINEYGKRHLYDEEFTIYPLIVKVLAPIGSGAPGKLGNGGIIDGSRTYEAGIGGGGYGGTWHYTNSSRMELALLPGAGGDGAVLIEYIGK